MEKSLFEQMGGTYCQQGDYLFPDLSMAPQEERSIGVWGEQLTKQVAERQGVTAVLKVADVMAWVRRINNIQTRVREIVYSEVIFA